MKVNVYVNWNEQKICDHEGFLEKMQDEVDNYYDDWSEEWLSEHYTYWELFVLSDDEKTEVEQRMKEELLEATINEHIGFDWEVATIEI